MATEHTLRVTPKHKYSANSIKHRINQIFILSLPMIIGGLGRVIMNLIDTVMIGNLGPSAIAAVNLSIFTSSLVTDFIIAIGAAVMSLSARRLGEGNISQINEILTESILITLIIGIPLSIMGACVAPYILPLINNDPLVIKQGTGYLRIINSGWIVVMLYYVFQGHYDGIGRPHIYLINTGVIVVFNVILKYCLIYGNFSFPAMGTTGAAIATISAYFFGLLTFLITMIRENKSFAIFKRCRNLAQRSIIRIKLYKLFAAIGVQNFAIISGFFVFITISGQISVIAMAVTGIVLQLANTLVLLANAFGRTAGTLASRSLGANEPQVAYNWGLQTATVGLLGLSPVFVIFLSGPDLVMSVFTKDTDMITSSMLIIQILGGGMTFDVFATILMNTMLGTGWVRSIVVWNILGIWALFIPLSVVGVVQYKVGILGLWTSLFVYRVVVGIVFLFEYQRKKWLNVLL
jgi:putative MATE family efflux protein